MPALSLRSTAVWIAAASLAAAAALPAVWWEPLHLDERVTLEFAPHSLPSIVGEIFVERGGAPLQFVVEHATLAWPGGLEGLRLPCFAFFLLALAWAGPVARELAGGPEAAMLPFLLALAPLAVGLATFARMYALFLWLVLLAAWLALRAGQSGARGDWIAAGAVAGGLVYVHPIAPLFAVPALACALATDDRPVSQVVQAARPALAAAVVVGVPYVYALAVLRSRYGVGEAGPIATTAGRSVPEESLHALTPGGWPGVVTFSLLAMVGLARIARERPRAAAVLVFWLAVPVAFFSVVPAETRFFGRYLLPALPAFLLLVVAGCRALGRRAVFVTALLAVALALEAREDVDRLRTMAKIDLGSLPTPSSHEVIFSSTGSPRSDRPPELLDDLVALEAEGARRVEELPAIDPRFAHDLVAKGVRNVRAFLELRGAEGGLWLLRGRPHRVGGATRRLGDDADLVAVRISSELLAVRTRRPEQHRRLIELGRRVRRAWGLGTPNDRWPRTIDEVDRLALE